MHRFALFALLALLLPSAASAEAQTLTLRAETLIEVAFFRVAPGQEEALGARYFSKVMPIAAEYGMKPLGRFAVSHIEHGPDDAAAWGFFEWPSLEAKERFEADRRFKRLRTVRDSMMDSLKVVYVEVAETVTLTLRDDRLYEFFGAWVNRHQAPHLQEYFAAAGPFIGSRGVQFHGQFTVVGSPEGYDFLPDTVGFIEWPDRSVKEAWFASEEFAQSGWHRTLALDRLYVVEGRAALQ